MTSPSQAATDKNPVTRGLHIAFSAPSRGKSTISGTWARTPATERADSPGLGLSTREDYYGAFLWIPTGTTSRRFTLETFGPGGSTTSGSGSRTSRNRSSSTRRSRTMAAFGCNTSRQTVRSSSAREVLSRWSPGKPTEHVHFAFPADDNAAVDAFHGRDPGGLQRRRPTRRAMIYHPGYYGAFLLDPDDNMSSWSTTTAKRLQRAPSGACRPRPGDSPPTLRGACRRPPSTARRIRRRSRRPRPGPRRSGGRRVGAADRTGLDQKNGGCSGSESSSRISRATPIASDAVRVQWPRLPATSPQAYTGGSGSQRKSSRDWSTPIATSAMSHPSSRPSVSTTPLRRPSGPVRNPVAPLATWTSMPWAR